MMAPLYHGWERRSDDQDEEQNDPRLMTTPEYGAYMARQQGRAEGRAEILKERKMPYRDRDEFERLESENEELREENDRLRGERDDETQRIKTLRDENRELRSRSGGRFPVTERNELLLEIDAMKHDLESAVAKQDELRKSIEEHGKRNLELRKERGELSEKLHAAEVLRAHAIAVEMVHAQLQDPNWLSDNVARKAIEDSGLAAKVMELQREREAAANARNDAAEFGKCGQPAQARDLVQLLVGQRRHTILMPLKYAVSAIRAAVDCWGQEVVEKANNLKIEG